MGRASGDRARCACTKKNGRLGRHARTAANGRDTMKVAESDNECNGTGEDEHSLDALDGRPADAGELPREAEARAPIGTAEARGEPCEAEHDGGRPPGEEDKRASSPRPSKGAEAQGKARGRKRSQPRAPDTPPGDWRSALVYRNTRDGRKLCRAPANAITILTHDASWTDVLAWDEFISAIVCTRAPPWHPDDDDGAPLAPWGESDITKLQAWLVRRYVLELSPTQCYQAAELVARKRQIHPIRDWLRGLRWDGERRLDTWLIRHLGAPDTEYVRLVSRWFLVSAVARVMVPGEKVDTMLILEGLQGIKKSTALRILFGKGWFTDASIDWGNKDRFEVLRGRWCVEMAELDGIHKADISRVKAFLATQEDYYRRPYAKAATAAPRQCVFAGTVNPNALGTYLRDDENRRFWPVRCTHEADLGALAAERELLFAEAMAVYEDPDLASRRWWPETAEEKALCAAEAEARRHGDAWQSLIDAYLDNPTRTEVTITEILKDAVKLDAPRMDHGASIRAATCLARAGWIKDGRERRNGQRETVYKRPPNPAASAETGAQLPREAEDAGAVARPWRRDPVAEAGLQPLPDGQAYAEAHYQGFAVVALPDRDIVRWLDPDEAARVATLPSYLLAKGKNGCRFALCECRPLCRNGHCENADMGKGGCTC
ncbi:virulence-associated E family protein [Polyangium spumosum]|nr:virulence-associated E family protein [Polyangium spumosum]